MSTRCQIGFYSAEPKTNEQISNDWEALIYRHQDGYPQENVKNGILPDIIPFLKAYRKIGSSFGIEYMSACMLTYLKQWHCGEKFPEDCHFFKLNGISFMRYNHGICNSIHGDIKYFYAVVPDKVIVYKADCRGGDNKFKKTQEIEIEDWEIKG